MKNTKVTSLHDAVKRYVEDGDTLCLGGFTTNRRPYAAIHEILRQGQKDFIGEGGPAGGDWDLLIGEDRVKAYINCYTANSGFSNVLRRFRAKAENGTLLMEDYSQDVEMLRLHAASLGLPYLPVKLMQGTDLVDKWGISKEEREKNVKNAFKLKRYRNLEGKSIILLDDVMTTGSTLKACVRELKKIKDIKIFLLTIAKSNI